MKHSILPYIVISLLAFSGLTAQAAQLASAKVLSVTGVAVKEAKDGSETPLKSGDILVEGDSVIVSGLSQAMLVFSNGSTLKVDERTSLSFKQLEQASFGGNKSYEQLAGDPSKSQTILELNYGEVDGHVKKLKPGSVFNIETPLGTAAIRGTRFNVRLTYNPVSGFMVLNIYNADGRLMSLRHFL